MPPKPAPAMTEPARKIYKRLVKLILSGGYRKGDQLPAQMVLRRNMNTSNNTLSEAMAVLVADGVIRRQSKRGTIVLNPHAIRSGSWSIGVMCLPASAQKPGAFYAELTLRLQTELAAQGHRPLPYYRLGAGSRIENYPHLQEDLEQGEVDGLISSVFVPNWDVQNLGQYMVPLCYAGDVTGTVNTGAVMDDASLIRQGLAQLKSQGVQRIVLVHGWSAEEVPMLINAMKETQQMLGLKPESCQWFQTPYAPGCGEVVLQQIMSQSQGERPEGFLIFDDYVAASMCEALAGKIFQPKLIVRGFSELPMHYAYPVQVYEISITELAKQAVRLAIEQLTRPEGPRLKLIAPVLRSTNG